MLKYRVWHKVKETMFFGKDILIDGRGVVYRLGDNGVILPYPANAVEVMHSTMQYDINKNEIFENDICRVGNDLYVVKYYATETSFMLFNTANGECESLTIYDIDANQIEVIGNVFRDKDIEIVKIDIDDDLVEWQSD